MYQVYSEKEFYQSLLELGYEFDEQDYKVAEKFGLTFGEKKSSLEHDAVEMSIPLKDIFLNRETNKILGDLTKSIYHNKPGKNLEKFLAEVFRKIPGVIEVKETGFGWGTDYGADLIVKYNLERIKGVELIEQIWVVQIKSYTGEHWQTDAVNQLETAVKKFNADVGILITTGERTKNLESAVNKLADEMNKKNVAVYLIAGADVAKFVLRYGLDLLI